MKKNLKPIDQDIHYKYSCPDVNCGYHHWLSLQETQTKSFKVVCSCGQIFSPKRISKTRIVYKKSIVSQKNKPLYKDTQVSSGVDFDSQCGRILESYGFSKSEVKVLIHNAKEEQTFGTSSALLKHILLNLNLPNIGDQK
jgi:hypothetical protein